jgi:hypothetical protein
MNVEHRYCEDQTTRQGGEPALAILPAVGRAPADDVIGVVNRFQEGIQVRLGPGLDRGGYEDQRQVRFLERATQ